MPASSSTVCPAPRPWGSTQGPKEEPDSGRGSGLPSGAMVSGEARVRGYGTAFLNI